MRWQEPCGSTFTVAPAAFHGDWSGLVGNGALSFDMRLLEIPSSGNTLPYEVRVGGAGGQLVWTAPGPTSTTDWLTHTVAIDEGSWTVLSGSFAGAMANVNDLRIRVRLFDNVEPGIRLGIDNVVLAPVPEPASMSVLALGALGLLRRKRRV